MDKNNILQFEADDTSKTGINGKQVFLTKRINGKISRNKDVDEESRYIPQHEEDLFIEFKNIKANPQNIPPNHNNKKKNTASKQKKIKRKKKKSIVTRIICLFLITAGVLLVAFVSPIFNIKKIEVVGNDSIDASTIESLSGIEEGKNIFQVSKSKVIKNIKRNSYINKVSINRKLPGILQINVEERKTIYQIKVINGYVYIDYQGYILEISSKKLNVPLIEGLSTKQEDLINGKRLISSDIDTLKVVLRIMDLAKNLDIDNLVSKILINNNEFVIESQKEDKIIYLGNATDLTNRMNYVKMIIENEKGNSGKIFVNGDFNNGFKPYFREEKNEGSTVK